MEKVFIFFMNHRQTMENITFNAHGICIHSHSWFHWRLIVSSIVVSFCRHRFSSVVDPPQLLALVIMADNDILYPDLSLTSSFNFHNSVLLQLSSLYNFLRGDSVVMQNYQFLMRRCYFHSTMLISSTVPGKLPFISRNDNFWDGMFYIDCHILIFFRFPVNLFSADITDFMAV